MQQADDFATAIKQRALALGFAACGITDADAVERETVLQYQQWRATGHHANMTYLERNDELRFDPRNLVSGAKSIIVVAMNYKPDTLQSAHLPQIAYYAYGRDYHKVVKKKLNKLLLFIQSKCPECNGRAFADSAPILERYWACKSGLGWVGKNGLLIIPKVGSYVVLGELLVDISLAGDEPLVRNYCGRCRQCLDNCPTGALYAPGRLDARKCISYMTIEAKGEIPEEMHSRLGNRLYGCDACQQCCPHNRKTACTPIADFTPRQELLTLSPEDILALSPEEFDRISAGSPIRRAGLDGLQKTAQILIQNRLSEMNNKNNK